MRDIRAELRKEHLNRKDARARLEALRLEAQAKVRGLSVQRIVWEETREVREAERAAHAARLRLKRTLERERLAFRAARIRALAANGFTQAAIATEVGVTPKAVWEVLHSNPRARVGGAA